VFVITEKLIYSIGKNRIVSEVAIRFAKKLVNCNAQFCCAQKFLNVAKERKYITNKTAARYINATV
jgi:hypothetical protein